jgi:hypothetical protein
MKRTIIFAIMLFLPAWSISISDLHVLVDDSISTPVRNILSEYSRRNSIILTSDFLDINDILQNQDGSLVIFASLEGDKIYKNLEKLNVIEIASDKLYLCISPDSALYKLVMDKQSNLAEILEIARNNSVVLIPSERFLIGQAVKNLAKKLQIKDPIEIENFEDLLHITAKSGAFAILPGLFVSYSAAGNIQNVAEIPQDVYSKLKYFIAVLDDKDYGNAEHFLNFILFNFNLLNNSNLK